MRTENFDVEAMFRCVRKVSDLGTGREGKKVLVGDSEDARTANFFFVGHIFQNWPSLRSVRIKTDAGIKTFDTATETVNGKSAFIFFWNELTEELWSQKVEREKLLDWFKTANKQDQIGMAELIAEDAGAKPPVFNIPGVLVWVDRRRVQTEIRKLNTAALRRLNTLTGVNHSATHEKAEQQRVAGHVACV